MRKLFIAVFVLLFCISAVGLVFASSGKKSEKQGALSTEDFKFLVTGVLHPYFEPMRDEMKDYQEATGITCAYRATKDFNQEQANVIIEGMIPQGYNGYAMWPEHPVSVNVTITELVDQGFPVVLIAGPAELPTDASFCIATDVKASAMKATENLIQAMGGKGNIVNLLGALSDPNTVLRKKGVEEVVSRYPNVKIIGEIADIDAFEAATTKIDSFLGARSDEVDGMVATAYVPTVVATEALIDMGDKRIKFVGIDDDAKVIQAIRDGYITGTMTQSPYGQAYGGLEVLRLLKLGYTPKEGHYFIDSGSFMVSKDNVDEYKDIIKKNAVEMLETFEEAHLNPPE